MMATYFSEIQATGDNNLQTLYLMNPNYNNHPNQTSPNMFLINPSTTLGHGGIPHATHPPQPGQQLIGIPLHGTHSSSTSLHSHDPSQHQISAPLHGVAVSRAHYNLWNPTVEPTATVARLQGLSLSISPHQRDPSAAVTVVEGVEGVIVGSKYLKATKELLDEFVNFGGYGNNGDRNGKAAKAAAGGHGGGCGSNKKVAEQLSSSQRQELQMKKAKLLNMLDEVEQRYKQYHSQMQGVISSMEQATGIGSAKAYTSLALQTISRQFRTLKDTIKSQLKGTTKRLGEEEDNITNIGGPVGPGSRLRLVDNYNQLRQHHNAAWRPQKGLPERAVSVLRAWLFDHFLHPYPKDSDKHMLANQTGLTRSQVSNWFINARVRLWKPMVEEMYLEETKSHKQNDDNSEDHNNTTTTTNIGNTPTSNDHKKDQIMTSKTTVAPLQPPHHHHTATNDMISVGFTLIGSSSDMESMISPKKQRSCGSDMHNMNSPSSILSMEMDMKPLGQDQTHSPIITSGSGFNPYMVHDIDRFNPNQLTLGLPHWENNLSLSDNHHHQNFILPTQAIHPSNGGYDDSIDIQSRKRFAAQLLHDFVA